MGISDRLAETTKGVWWAAGAVGCVLTLVGYISRIETERRKVEESLVETKNSNAKVQDENRLLKQQISEKLALIEGARAANKAELSKAIENLDQKYQDQVRKLESSLVERDQRIASLLVTIGASKPPKDDIPNPENKSTARDLGKQGPGSVEQTFLPPNSSALQTVFENAQFKAVATSVRPSAGKRNITITIELHNKTSAMLYLAVDRRSRPQATTESGDKFENVSLSGLKSIGSLRQDTFENNGNYTAIPVQGSIRATWEVPSKRGEPPAQGKRLELTVELLWLSDSGPKRLPFVASSIRLQ